MTNLDHNCSCQLEQKNILFRFFHQYTIPVHWWKNAKSMIFCSRWHEQLWSRLVILFKKSGYFFWKIPKKCKKWKKKYFFTFQRLLTTLTLGFWRNKIFKKFPNQFHIRISKFQQILAFCLGQRWCWRWRC